MMILLCMSFGVILQSTLTALSFTLKAQCIKKPSKTASKLYSTSLLFLLSMYASKALSTLNWDQMFYTLLAECMLMFAILTYLFGMIAQAMSSCSPIKSETGQQLWTPYYRPPLFGYGYVMYHVHFYYELLNYIGQYPVTKMVPAFIWGIRQITNILSKLQK